MVNTFFYLTLIIATLSTAMSSFAENTDISLGDCINLALENNPQLDVAEQQYFQATGIVQQAESGYLPRLSVGASVARLHIEDLQPVDEDNVLKGGLSASQLLYDFGRTTGGVESTVFSRHAAQSNLEQKVHDVVFLVKEAYYSGLEKKALVQVARQTVDNYEKQLYRAKKFYEAGIRTQIDTTNAELELANAKLNLLRSKSNLKSARVELEQVIGTQPNNGAYRLVSTYTTISKIVDTAPPLNYSLTELLEVAPNNRPGMEQLNQLFFASQASLKKAKGDNWPVLSAQGSYDTYETDLQTLNDQWQLTALLTWEIFSGFETEGKIAENKALMMEIAASKHELELAIKKDITDSHLRAEENHEALDIAALAVDLAIRNLELADGRYKAGLGDMLEFNDAQLNYSSSQSDLISTYFAYLTAIARMERAAGINPGVPQDTVQDMLEPRS